MTEYYTWYNKNGQQSVHDDDIYIFFLRNMMMIFNLKEKDQILIRV